MESDKPGSRRSLFVAAVAFVIGVGVTLGGTALMQHLGTSDAPADTDALSRFYDQKLHWGPCTGFSDTLRLTTECTRVEVPVNYDRPSGDTAFIALSRTRASEQKIGSVLFNPGGPGMSGLWLAETGADTELAKKFDRVGFDPRGVGASVPAVRCYNGPEHDAERAANWGIDNTPEGIKAQEAHSKEFAQICADRTGTELLAHIGTKDVVRDMDVIRAALGDDKLTYVGYSYGTRLGTVYADTFPDKVRAMVLDGALDPKQDKVQKILKQSEGFQKAFNDYATDCAKAPGCPLGHDPLASVAAYQALIRPLIDGPALTDDPRGLSLDDATTGTMAALYSPKQWPRLTQGLQELAQGRGDMLLKLADRYSEREPDGTYDGSDDTQTAIRCVDDEPLTDPKVLGDLDTKARQLAPFLDEGRGTGHAARPSCAFWPVPNTMRPGEVSVEGIPELVVVAVTGDPATPYEAGVDLAKQLNARLVTYEGTQHTVYLDGERCIDDPVTNYLVTLALPPHGLRC